MNQMKQVFTEMEADSRIKSKRCKECYAADCRSTPLLHKEDCLRKHLQYICSTCGRCICIQQDEHRKLRRWNFPFSSLYDAVQYLKTADVTLDTVCGIYKYQNKKGRVFYKIFQDDSAFKKFIDGQKDKQVISVNAVYRHEADSMQNNGQMRMLNDEEVRTYLKEQTEQRRNKRKNKSYGARMMKERVKL